MFTEKFGKYACVGDSISCEVDGLTITARIHDDSDHGVPWDNSDCHGPVTKWIRRGKNAGERVLSEDRGSFRYYDFSEACKLALKDGWGITGGKKEGESAKAYASRCAERDFEVLRAWCNDEWSYCGIALQVEFDEIELVQDYQHALWCIELNYPDSDNSYLQEVANELLDEALESAKTRVLELKESLAQIA